MKHILTTFIILILLIGCGLMGTSKGEDEEPKQIHVPQKFTVEIPTILKKSTSEKQIKKMRKSNWYN